MILTFTGLLNYTCIYQFRHNEEILYIGSCKNFFKRIGKHIENITRKHRNKPFADYLEQYQNEIDVDILEKLDNDITNEDLRRKEQYWMNKQKTRFNSIRAYVTKEQKKIDRNNWCNHTPKGKKYKSEWHKQRRSYKSCCIKCEKEMSFMSINRHHKSHKK